MRSTKVTGGLQHATTRLRVSNCTLAGHLATVSSQEVSPRVATFGVQYRLLEAAETVSLSEEAAGLRTEPTTTSKLVARITANATEGKKEYSAPRTATT